MKTLLFYALFALLVAFGGAPAYADDPRLPRAREFMLMSQCVGGSSQERKIHLCACALEKTQEDGFWPDYDNHQDYLDDRREFGEKFTKNIKYFFNAASAKCQKWR